jgi:hypothetical protein
VTTADRLKLYRLLGLDVSLTPDKRLNVSGPNALRDIARPSLLKHRAELIAELARNRDSAEKLLPFSETGFSSGLEGKFAQRIEVPPPAACV